MKVYQENYLKLKLVDEIIIQDSHDTGACYGMKKCVEIVYKKGKMVKREGLQVIAEKMKELEPGQNEAHKFLGCEKGEDIDMERILKWVMTETENRINNLIRLELYDKNLIKAISCRVIPAVVYVMNVWRFTKTDLDKLDKIIKRILRENHMHGKQGSDERLYLRRKIGGRGLKSFKDVYNETKIRIACYMTLSNMHGSRQYGRETWRMIELQLILKQKES